ncbi:hypothetical protein Tiera_009 [Polaromonas phage Tiera]|nr:hypothetical protein Tiera_009 [Polaromonas phage Tiera]
MSLADLRAQQAARTASVQQAQTGMQSSDSIAGNVPAPLDTAPSEGAPLNSAGFVEKDSGEGKAGEMPLVSRAPLSPTTIAPIDNERGGVPMAEDPDRVRSAADSTSSVVVQEIRNLNAEKARVRYAPQEEAPVVVKYEPVAGDFKNIRLNQFYPRDMNKVVPVDGWYHPKNDEEREMLEHYAKTGYVEAALGSEDDAE